MSVRIVAFPYTPPTHTMMGKRRLCDRESLFPSDCNPLFCYFPFFLLSVCICVKHTPSFRDFSSTCPRGFNNLVWQIKRRVGYRWARISETDIDRTDRWENLLRQDHESVSLLLCLSVSVSSVPVYPVYRVHRDYSSLLSFSFCVLCPRPTAMLIWTPLKPFNTCRL